MKNDNVILGIDLGTSAIKCVAMSVSGRVVATTEAAFPVTRELPGQAEQNPLDWLAALRLRSSSWTERLRNRSLPSASPASCPPCLPARWSAVAVSDHLDG